MLALFQTLDDPTGISKAVGNIGIIHWRKGNYDAARACFEKELALCEKLGDQWGIAEAISNMGIVDWRQGDYAAARAGFEKSLRLYSNPK